MTSYTSGPLRLFENTGSIVTNNVRRVQCSANSSLPVERTDSAVPCEGAICVATHSLTLNVLHLLKISLTIDFRMVNFD
jgi:hypothetical protein